MTLYVPGVRERRLCISHLSFDANPMIVSFACFLCGLASSKRFFIEASIPTRYRLNTDLSTDGQENACRSE